MRRADTQQAAWTFDAILPRAGGFLVTGTNPSGQPFTEPLHVAAVADRAWANPPEEIDALREQVEPVAVIESRLHPAEHFEDRDTPKTRRRRASPRRSVVAIGNRLKTRPRR